MTKINDMDDENMDIFSPILITRYANKAITLIYSIEKILRILLPVLVILSIVIIFDTFDINDYFKISDNVFDMLLSAISLATIVMIIYLLQMVLKARKKLDKWALIFDQNSLRTALSMSLSPPIKDNLLNTIIENIQELGDPLQEYLRNNPQDSSNFFNHKLNDFTFDILIDQTKINNSNNASTSLRESIDKHGVIIAKILEKSQPVEISDVKLFVDSISAYIKTTKNYVGLAVLVGNQVKLESLLYTMNYSNKNLGYLIAIEKPVSLTSEFIS